MEIYLTEVVCVINKILTKQGFVLLEQSNFMISNFLDFEIDLFSFNERENIKVFWRFEKN